MALIAGLHEAIDAVEQDRSCRAVILTGAGRGFCAGFDMKGGDYDGDPTSRPLADLLAGQKRLSGIALRLHELPKAVIAAVNGPAAGGGFALAVAADIRVASDTAVFLAANVKIGVSGGEMGLSWRLPRLIGLARATELLLTGRRMTAEEALAAGLVRSRRGGRCAVRRRDRGRRGGCCEQLLLHVDDEGAARRIGVGGLAAPRAVPGGSHAGAVQLHRRRRRGGARPSGRVVRHSSTDHHDVTSDRPE